MQPKLTLCSRIRKLSSENTGIFRCNPLSMKSVIPSIFTGVSNPPPFRCCIWPPWEAGFYGLTLTLTSYYAPNVISLRTGLCIVLRPEFYWRLGWIVLTVLNSFSQTGNQERHVNICYCGNISFGHGWRRTIVSYDIPAARLPKKMQGSITISQTIQYKFNCGGQHHYLQVTW